MKRSTQVEYEDASSEVRAVYDEIMDTMGSPTVLNFLKALGHNPHALRAVWSMLRETVIEGEIPALLKQLILFKVSITAGNEYCTSLHGHGALNLDPTLQDRSGDHEDQQQRERNVDQARHVDLGPDVECLVSVESSFHRLPLEPRSAPTSTEAAEKPWRVALRTRRPRIQGGVTKA